MTPARHPSAATLDAYALGELRPAFLAVVGAHVRACEICGAAALPAEARAGASLLAGPPAAMGVSAFQRTWDRLADPELSAAPGIAFGRKRWAAPGLWVRHAPRAFRGDDQLFLLKAPPRIGIPHNHDGPELTLMLRGSLEDESGRYSTGDLCEMPPGGAHRPVAGPQGCLCLVASERPMRMPTLIGRLAQMLAGA